MKKTLPVFYGSVISTTLITILLTTINFFAQAQGCGCDHTIEPPADRITPVFIYGDSLGIQPGQTVCLKAGFYMQIRFSKIIGEPGNPVIIKNCGGLVEVGDNANFGRWYAGDIIGCKNIRLTGSGDPAYKYGIKLGKSGDSGLKIGGYSSDTEIDHLEIGNANFAGILAKTDFGGNPPPGLTEMNNVNIHDNYVHDSRGEGMYIGETKSPGQNFRHLEVWNNIITRSGLELIQVANVIEDAQVHHNVFYKSATRNIVYQNKGMQIGDNSVGRYYNNFLIGSPSNLMIIMGSGNIEVSNNYMAGAGDPGFFIDNRAFSLIGAPINIHGNFIMDVNPVFPFFNVFNEVNPVNLTENKLEGNNVVYGLGPDSTITVVNESGNTHQVCERVQFVDVLSDNFNLAPGSPYQDLGLLHDVSNLNKRPYVALIPDQLIDTESHREISVTATDPDGDPVILEPFNLPAFVSFIDKGNGKGVFTLNPQAGDIGIYYGARVRVTDSEGSMNTEYFSIKVLDRYAFIATASSSLESNLPENTLDGNMSTRWIAAEGSGQWIKYDLREDKLVTSVDIAFFEGATHTYGFDIEISEDSVAWTNVLSGSSNGTTTDFETFTFDEVRARYLRIVNTGTSVNSYNEVVIHGTPAPVSHEFYPTDDVYLDGKKIYNNYYLRVKGPGRRSFMRFTVDNLDAAKCPVVSAKLKVTAIESGYGKLKIYLGEQSNWSERYPRIWELPDPLQVLDELTTYFLAGKVYELDVAGAVADNGVYNFILTHEFSGSGVTFSSAEGWFPPELTLSTLRGAQPSPLATAERSFRLFSGDDSTGDPAKILEAISLFPNPVKDKVTVDLFSDESGFVTVEIYDQLGRPFFQKKWMNENQFLDLDLSSFNMDPGLYIIKVKKDGHPLETLRMFKQ